MTRDRKRLGFMTVVAAAVVPLALASMAYGCGVLATLALDAKSGRAGAGVSGTGTNYNTSPRSSDVTLRFNSRSGPVLWQGRPAANGRISYAFNLPSARPGNYVVLATQFSATGTPVAGTPGRAPVRIAGKKKKKKSGLAAGPSQLSPPADRGGPSLDTAPGSLGALVLSLALAGGGLVLLVGGSRRGRGGLPTARS